MVKNAYAFVNLAMAAFVLSAVAVRFVFPAVSAEGPAFWIVRTSPVPMRAFLWSKFWTGLVPVLIAGGGPHHRLELVPRRRALPEGRWRAVAIFFMTFALVGLAAGMGAIYPRFNAENLTQVAGSYGGIAYMVLAVLFILVEIVAPGLALVRLSLARVSRPAASRRPQVGADGAPPPRPRWASPSRPSGRRCSAASAPSRPSAAVAPGCEQRHSAG